MVAILENPEVRRLVQTFSVSEYEALGERINGNRTELIRGIIIEKMPASPLHSFLVARLRELAQTAARPDAHCRQEQPIRLKDSMPEPDLAVVTGQPSDYRRSHPITALLVVEVAVSSLGLDREKAALYAEAGVTEYWLIVAGKETVESYAGPEAGVYLQQRSYGRAETLVSTALPRLRVRACPPPRLGSPSRARDKSPGTPGCATRCAGAPDPFC